MTSPISDCPQPETPIRERAWSDAQRTDMHRDAFEREARDWDMPTKKNGTDNLVYSEPRTALAWCFWQAAMRYLDGKEKQP